MNKAWFVLVTVLAMLIGGAIGVAAQAPPEVRNGPATPVAIVDPLPVPIDGSITGEVDANVSGQVEVVNPTGEQLAVDLDSSDLSSLATRLDDIEQAVGAVETAVEGSADSAPANAYYDSGSLGQCDDDCGTPKTFDAMAVEFVSLNTWNDRFRFYLTYQGEEVFSIGGFFGPMPNSTVIPLSQPVLADAWEFDCLNLVENCEPRLTLTGTR